MSKKKNICSAYGTYKTLFASKEKALDFIEKYGAEIKSRNGYAPVRAYYCHFCNGWHVTSKPFTSAQIRKMKKTGVELVDTRKPKKCHYKVYDDMNDYTARHYNKRDFRYLEDEVSAISLLLQDGVSRELLTKVDHLYKLADIILDGNGPKNRKRSLRNDIDWISEQVYGRNAA